MIKEKDKLLKELKFIEDSFKSGIITKSEYDSAKVRIQAKLDNIPDEVTEVPKEPTREYTPKVEVYTPETRVEKKVETFSPESFTAKEEPNPEPFTHKEEPKKDKVKLETYGAKKKSKTLLWFALLLLVVIIFFTVNSNNVQQGIESDPVPFVPVCSVDLDCYQTGYFGKCINPDTEQAECQFVQAKKINITVINDPDCKVCDSSRMKSTLKQIYPGALFIELDKRNAKNLLKDFEITVLPAYLFDEKVKSTKRFPKTESALIEVNDIYMMKPTATGSPYFYTHSELTNLVELYIDPKTTTSIKAFQNLVELFKDRKFDFKVRYYSQNPSNELLTQICIRDFSESRYKLYMQCRYDDELANDKSLKCMEDLAIPQDDINECIENRSQALLNSDMNNAERFFINSVPTFIFNNQYKKGGSLSVEILDDFYCKLNKC